MTLKIICITFILLLMGCPKEPPRNDCYYGYVFTGTVKDGGNSPLEAVEVRNSHFTGIENEPIATTDVNGTYTVFAPSYLNRETQTINFRKAGYQDKFSAPLTSDEVLSACNVKINITRDVVLIP